ncbi:MAG: hypothetical protein M1828_005305 [Chrysothrix sp. TS-e1954]|nr:MAG: hypothetical protein M1828_005305 [Chrysothrix sp. TS-e1954]
MAAVPELLLALSGHESALFDHDERESAEFVTPAEAALLHRLGRLANLHRALRSHCERIIHSKLGTIARAVAVRIRTAHLDRFTKSIIQFEHRVLRRETDLVAAYDNVPLASVVGHFDDWNRVLEWLWEVLSFICLPDLQESIEQAPSTHSGPALIDFLRHASSTGYVEIESLAKDLSTTAERVSLKQLASLLLASGSDRVNEANFAICSTRISNESPLALEVRPDLLPEYLTADTAASVLFVAMLLRQLQSVSDVSSSRQSMVTRFRRVQSLSALPLPLSRTTLTSAISSLRSTLVRELAEGVLPTQSVLDVLAHLKDYFLVGLGDFTDALVGEADKYMRSRHSHLGMSGHRAAQDIAGLMMTENEITEVLKKTHLAMASTSKSSPTTERSQDWARDTLVLSIPCVPTSEGSSYPRTTSEKMPPRVSYTRSAFDHFLLSTPIRLSMKLQPPMDIFLSSADLETYSSIHSYLLSIRRAHLRLTDLWRWGSLRKTRPVTVINLRNGRYRRVQSQQHSRSRDERRAQYLRHVWSVTATAVYVLTEIGEYLTGEVISNSWQAFLTWATGAQGSKHVSKSFETGYVQARSVLTPLSNMGVSPSTGPQPYAQHHESSLPLDPELLAHAHRQYLSALFKALLLSNESFTKHLQTMMTRVDELVAYLSRLQEIWNRIDLREEGVEETTARQSYAVDSDEVHNELDNTVLRLQKALQQLTSSLQESDAPSSAARPDLDASSTKTGFEPWSNHRVDRLSFRLECRANGVWLKDRMAPVAD